MFQFPVAENFYSIEISAHKFRLAQQLLGDHGSRFKNVEVIQVHHSILPAKRGIIKTPLGQPPDQGHLPTLETEADASAGAGFLALVTFAACFSMSGALAAAEPFDSVPCAGAGFEIMQTQHVALLFRRRNVFHAACKFPLVGAAIATRRSSL